MNYGEIERQTFRTFLAFSTLLVAVIIVFFNVTSDIYRISDIDYDKNLKLDMNSLERLMGTSIWLVDDAYFGSFYEDNPTVERISIGKELPDKLTVQIDISEKLAYIQDNRQSPPRTFVLYKNLYTLNTPTNEGILSLTINNGPVLDGFLEEIVTFVMTLKKYPINLYNIEMIYDGESIEVEHLNLVFLLGSPSDLGRKASVVGYYISEEPCEGEVRIFYSEDIQRYKGITNCK
tara:strand:+ start:2056 stop:2757 length:702 start_codon:yes stop_codon:yes gene_type:complete